MTQKFWHVISSLLAVATLIGIDVRPSPAQVLEKPYEDVDVFYATNRRPERRKSVEDGRYLLAQSPTFGIHRAPVSYGTALVTLPKSRKFGEVARPEVYGIVSIRGVDLSKDNVLIAVTPRKASDFFGEINRQAAAKQSKQAVIFVHGYNTHFDEAFVVLASISKDLNAPVILFSWPSSGRLSGYNRDTATAKWALSDFSKFLTEFVARTGFESVTLAAHSMGSQILIDAIMGLDRSQSLGTSPFKRIVLLAPDLEVPKFRDFLESSGSSDREVLLFVRSNDLALRASSVANMAPRLGALTGEKAIFPGVTTIDLRNVRRAYALDYRHGYYRAGIYVALLAKWTPDVMTLSHPGGTYSVKPIVTKQGRYWLPHE